MASSRTRDLISGTFHLALLDALGFMDWTFSRMDAEKRSLEEVGFGGMADEANSSLLVVD